jgi:hypothetical protein
MNKQFSSSNCFVTVLTVLIILTFTLSLPAQKRVRTTILPLAEDTSLNPHDFTDEYYAKNGVSPKYILGRRTGTDFLSVFGISSNPTHRNVRVLATLPAYSDTGEILFWTPLGEFNPEGFTEDGLGAEARLMADNNPIYVFPRHNLPSFSFGNSRQAPLIYETQTYLYEKGNPLGLRLILLVNFNDKAFNTKEGAQIMKYMQDKNGLSLDGTPIIKDLNDLVILTKYECVNIQKRGFRDDTDYAGYYAISPVIREPLKGVIAPDAFLFTGLAPDETAFLREFSCLQKTGDWCSE